jgi:hypothetical protein
VAVALAVMAWGALSVIIPVAADSVPVRLSDQEFWQLIDDVSEPNGSFRSDNLLSNELQFQLVVPELTRVVKLGRAYLGVGPEQNFTYIAALRPSIAFIVDVRRGNLDLHLLYKAIFELANSRADFVGLLFSKPRPAGLNTRSSAKAIFEAYASVAMSDRLFVETMARVRDRLSTAHAFALSEDDVRGIEFVYRAFAMFGPGIKYSPLGLNGGTVQPTYAELMAATDGLGQAQAFLATEDRFLYVKNMESRNLIVPVVGNFAGPKTIAAVGAYLARMGATVSAFYLSNVEEYLRRDGLWGDFCANVAALPHDASSTFIRSTRASSGVPADGMTSELGPFSDASHCR